MFCREFKKGVVVLKQQTVHVWAQTVFIPASVWLPSLKTLDTIGNCQRPVFSLGVSQHMHKTTNLWKFELKKLRDKKWKKKPCYTKLCDFRCLISRPQILNLRSWNQIIRKLLLSWKLRHFRFYANNDFEWIPIVSTAFTWGVQNININWFKMARLRDLHVQTLQNTGERILDS